MFLIELPYSNACQNLAAEEILLKEFSNNYFLIYRNSPSVVVGKHQNALRETNFPFLFENNIPIFRRISGGGTVYHDEGNINFSIIQNSDGENMVDFERYTAPIIGFLKSFGLDAQFGKRHEIVINGFKVSGNAEHIHRHRILHHGTLLFDTDLSVLNKALCREINNYSDRAVNSVPGNVGNILPMLQKSMSIKQFIEELLQYLTINKFASHHVLSTDFETKVNHLCAQKYNSSVWNLNYHADYTFKVIDVQYGILMEIGIEKGIIVKTKNNGMNKFFFADLSSKLIGKAHNLQSIEEFGTSTIEKHSNQQITVNKIVKIFF